MPRHPHSLAVLAALAAPLFLAVGGARAESVDLTRATCADFAGMNGNDQAQLSLWLAGYFAGGAQKPLLDLDKISAAPGALQALCRKSPQLSLLSAETRAVFVPAP
jgi:hypothetical protein